MRALVVSAHPDDETMFAGGYIARLAAEGHDVVLLCSTRGEGGEVGEPPVGPLERLGELREQELRCAGRALGAREVRFLEFVDPRMEIGGTASAIDASLEQFVAALRPHLEALRPELVLTHGSNGEYGHPQHVFTHRAVFRALADLGPAAPGQVVTWTAAYPDNLEQRLTNQDDPADEVLDVTPWLAAKQAAAACHVSQHAMFLRNNPGKSLPEVIRRVESFRHWRPEDVRHVAQAL